MANVARTAPLGAGEELLTFWPTSFKFPHGHRDVATEAAPLMIAADVRP